MKVKLNHSVFFLVVGRLGKSLVTSKALPIIHASKISQVYIFSQVKGAELHGISYVTIPKWIINLKPNLLRNLLRLFYEPIQLLYYAIKFRPGYINGVYTLPKGLNSLIVGWLVGSKSIVSVIGGKKEIETYLPFTSLWKELNIWILKKADIVTTKGEVISEYLVKNGVRSSKIFTLNGSIQVKFKLLPDVNRNIDVLFCGNFSELKGPNRVVQVIEKFYQENIPINAVFVGSGKLYNFIEKEINKKGLKNIKLLGHVENTEYYFQRSKLLLMPSSSEGLSTAMLEAMACGCVPVVSNVGAMTEAALHEKNAIVVDDYKDINGFFQHAKYLLNNKSKWAELSNNGINIVKTKYTPIAQSFIINEIIFELTKRQT
ncbi:MAG: glycosyltransferase [Bacteroidales bacterium]|nr:glycosyltransferase [Bacteroidales bacterium]